MQAVMGCKAEDMEWQSITQRQIAKIVGITSRWLSKNSRNFSIYKVAQTFGIGRNTLRLWIERFGYKYAATKLNIDESELQYQIQKFRAKKIVELLEIRGYEARYEIIRKYVRFYWLGDKK